MHEIEKGRATTASKMALQTVENSKNEGLKSQTYGLGGLKWWFTRAKP